jgi:hypothetical protein
MLVENYMEIKIPNKKQDFYVVELTQQRSHMRCSLKREFYRDWMVLSMSPSKRIYSSLYAGMSILQGGMERGEV